VVVEDFDEKNDDEDEDDGRVEVRHVEGGAETTHERVRRDNCGHQQRRQLDAETLNQSRQCRGATWTPTSPTKYR